MEYSNLSVYISDTSTYASRANTYIFKGDYKGNITVTAQWKEYSTGMDNKGHKRRKIDKYTIN